MEHLTTSLAMFCVRRFSPENYLPTYLPTYKIRYSCISDARRVHGVPTIRHVHTYIRIYIRITSTIYPPGQRLMKVTFPPPHPPLLSEQ